jgi:hypothetical protein
VRQNRPHSEIVIQRTQRPANGRMLVKRDVIVLLNRTAPTPGQERINLLDVVSETLQGH